MAEPRRLDRFAVLAELGQGERTGYDLKQVFSRTGPRAWHLAQAQIYGALKTLEHDGLATMRSVPSKSHPPRNIYTITQRGREELRRWLATPMRPASLKDELVLRVHLTDPPDLALLREPLVERRQTATARAKTFEAERADALHANARVRAAAVDHLIRIERLRAEWCDEVLALLDSAKTSSVPVRRGRQK